MLINMKDILIKSKKEKVAIPQFNINNLEWIKYILDVCQEKQQPVILGVSISAANYMGGFKNVYDMVTNLIDNLKINVPVSLHLDHAKTYDEVKNAIDSGFTSVMIDCSSKSLDDNILVTKKVVEYAHERDIIVEGEIGMISSNEYASLDDCERYFKETNIDMLAPAIGNQHGIYTNKPNLQFDLLKKISNNIYIPIVLHGGSLISDDDIKKLINYGITKININTELQIAWTEGLKEGLEKNKDVYDPRKVISFGEEKMKDLIRHKIDLFN